MRNHRGARISRPRSILQSQVSLPSPVPPPWYSAAAPSESRRRRIGAATSNAASCQRIRQTGMSQRSIGGRIRGECQHSVNSLQSSDEVMTIGMRRDREGRWIPWLGPVSRTMSIVYELHRHDLTLMLGAFSRLPLRFRATVDLAPRHALGEEPSGEPMYIPSAEFSEGQAFSSKSRVDRIRAVDTLHRTSPCGVPVMRLTQRRTQRDFCSLPDCIPHMSGERCTARRGEVLAPIGASAGFFGFEFPEHRFASGLV